MFELHILELPKLPKVLARIEKGEEVSDESIIRWMEFFSGKTQEDFEAMAKQNEYMEEAVNALFELSADEKKRLEYEAREKAIRDYNSQMHSAERRGLEHGHAIGLEQGRAIGIEEGIELALKILKLKSQGRSAEEISKDCDLPLEQVERIME